MIIDKNAFSQSQIDSKLWVCDELDIINSLRNDPLKIAVLGGWHGVLPFLLFTSSDLPIKYIHSYDIDPRCKEIAEVINNNWSPALVGEDFPYFKAFTADVNFKDFSEYDIIINTSTEHFNYHNWLHTVRNDAIIVLQGCDLKTDDHTNVPNNMTDFIKTFNLDVILYAGTKTYNYRTTGEFNRYMIIGTK